jgi:hypothetical protein
MVPATYILWGGAGTMTVSVTRDSTVIPRADWAVARWLGAPAAGCRGETAWLRFQHADPAQSNISIVTRLLPTPMPASQAPTLCICAVGPAT